MRYDLPLGLAGLLFLLTIGAPAWAAPEDDLAEEELREIERALAEDAPATPETPVAAPLPTMGLGRIFQSMNPDIAIIMDVAAAAFSDPNPLQIGAHDPRRNGFNLQQLEMSIGSPVDPFLRFDSNIVFSQFGVEIEEAYATSMGLPYDLQARAGQFLTRFGRINPTHPHSWEFADQPLVLGKFMGPEGNRGLGVELSWLSPLPWYAEVVGSLTDAQGAASARSFLGASSQPVLTPLDVQATTALKQFFPLSRDWSLAWGLSGATGPNPTGRANRSDLFGSDLYLKYRPLAGDSFTTVSLTAEGFARRRQVPGDNLVDYGGYTSLFWRFAQQWGTAVRLERVTGVPGDYLDPEWAGDRTRLSADLTFWPTEFSRLRWQVSRDQPSWRNEPIYGTFLTLETVIGAHGAHQF